MPKNSNLISSRAGHQDPCSANCFGGARGDRGSTILIRVNPAALVRQIEAYLSSRGVPVCARPFQVASLNSGGLVKINGRAVVLLNSAAPPVERLMALADALCSLDFEPESLSIEVKRLVSKALAKRRWRRRQLVGARRRNNLLWLRSRLVLQRPGLRACEANDRKS